MINFVNVETIWRDIFYKQLQIDPVEHPVVLTEAILNPKFNREKMVQIMFETFSVPSIYAIDQPFLSIHSSGRTTGFVAEIGDSVSQFVPIYEGKVIQYAAMRQDYASHHLTNWLKKMMKCDSTDIGNYRLFKDMKEKGCYIAFDYQTKLQKSSISDDCIFH